MGLASLFNGGGLNSDILRLRAGDLCLVMVEVGVAFPSILKECKKTEDIQDCY